MYIHDPMGKTRDPRVVALYLPQFHRVAENDAWWGDGFTEWTNARKGRQWFSWHEQPHEPSELGYYDLLDPMVRQRQSELAQEHGVAGFCYYHYWFEGRRLLERPFQSVLESGTPDIPFCLCWANESWTGAWGGQERRVLQEQGYSESDHRIHAQFLSAALGDSRAIRVDGRPVLLVYRASKIPDVKKATDIWRKVWTEVGPGEVLLVRVESGPLEMDDPRPLGFDASMEFQPAWRDMGLPDNWIVRYAWRMLGRRIPAVHEYGALVERMLKRPEPPWPRFPGLTPMWDNTCRRNGRGLVLKGSTPQLYGRWLEDCLDRASRLPFPDPLVFVNAWNEWGEGCHLEPDKRHGRAYLRETSRRISLWPGLDAL
jgi:lipopolysaccharide biosynthesis protein